MKISEIIDNLEDIRSTAGDIVCLVEVEVNGVTYIVECDEVSYEDRDVHGESALFMC